MGSYLASGMASGMASETDESVTDLLIRGGVVVPCDSSRSAFIGDVAVCNGEIVRVGPGPGIGVCQGSGPVVDRLPGPGPGPGPGPEVGPGSAPGAGRPGVAAGPTAAARVIDASDCAVIPGFVNAHTHTLMERGVFEDLPFPVWLNDFALPKDKAYEPRHQRAGALLCQAEMISNGTTSFIDIFRFPEESARVAQTSGLRATISPQVIDEPAGAGESLASNEEFVDAWRGRHPRVRAWFGPHSLYTVHASTYGRMRDLAEQLGVGIHTHLAESRAETRAVAELSGGLTPAQWLDRLVGLGPHLVAAHCVELNDDDLARVAFSGMGVAHCPTSNMKLGNGAARIPELLAAGANVGLGTDSIMTNNNLDPFEEMRQAGLLAKFSSGDAEVLPSLELLEMATIGSAGALGLADSVGSLEVGKRADIAVVGLDRPHAWPAFCEGGGNVIEQLVWSCSGSDVRYTIVDGKVLLDDRRLLTLDLEEIRDLTHREARHLLTKAGVFEHVVGKYQGERT